MIPLIRPLRFAGFRVTNSSLAQQKIGRHLETPPNIIDFTPLDPAAISTSMIQKEGPDQQVTRQAVRLKKGPLAKIL